MEKKQNKIKPYKNIKEDNDQNIVSEPQAA